MSYQASWRHTRGFGPLCIAVAALFALAGIVTRSPLLIGVGAVPIAYLYMIGCRLTVYIDDTRIRYQGWLKASEARWDQIVSVTRGTDLPYPRSRYHGASSYEVTTRAERFTVNLLYFPPEFARAFTDTAMRYGVIRRAV
jgi:hypothetical protein